MHFEIDGFNLNKIIANGKRFMAYEIINRLKIKENLEMLIKLSSLVLIRENKKGQLYKVFKIYLILIGVPDAICDIDSTLHIGVSRRVSN